MPIRCFPSLPFLSFSSLGPLFSLPFLLLCKHKIAPSALMSERKIALLRAPGLGHRSARSGITNSKRSRKPFLLPPNTLVAFPSPLEFPRDPTTLFKKPKLGPLRANLGIRGRWCVRRKARFSGPCGPKSLEFGHSPGLIQALFRPGCPKIPSAR